MTLEDRIAERLNQALDRLAAGGFDAPAADRGLAVGGPDSPMIVITVADVARIAALTVEDDTQH